MERVACSFCQRMLSAFVSFWKVVLTFTVSFDLGLSICLLMGMLVRVTLDISLCAGEPNILYRGMLRMFNKFRNKSVASLLVVSSRYFALRTALYILHLTFDAFSRRFYPKRLTVNSGYTFFFNQYVCSLGIEPTTFCATNAMLYH